MFTRALSMALPSGSQMVQRTYPQIGGFLRGRYYYAISIPGNEHKGHRGNGCGNCEGNCNPYTRFLPYALLIGCLGGISVGVSEEKDPLDKFCSGIAGGIAGAFLGAAYPITVPAAAATCFSCFSQSVWNNTESVVR